MTKRLILILSVAFCPPLSTSAWAQDCANPADQPAVCTVDAYAGLEGERLRSFDLDGSALVERDQVLELELDAFDQNRRRFPKDRLRFDFDANDCREMVKVERTDIGRFSLHTGGGRGNCTISFWLPGNLNYEWSLDLQIAPRTRSGYSNSEADFVSESLYQALLGRETDPQGLRDTSAAIQRGELDRRLQEILKSPEFRARIREAHPAWLLEQLYMGILGRKPDDWGIRTFTPRLQRGQISEVTRELLNSEEFERRLPNR